MVQTNYDRQAKLAQSAGLPQLQALSQGANPRQVRPFVALGELNARMAQMQSDKMLQGAAPPGSMPTLREKIEQSLQQLKAQAAQQQAAQQAQQQAPGMFQVPEGTPTPQMQPQAEEMAQAPAEGAMPMYSGGVAQLPVDGRMFGYANGGIIAFSGKERSDVPRIGEEVPLPPEERARLERELEMRLIGEKERAGKSTSEPSPTSSTLEEQNLTPEEYLARKGELRRAQPPKEPQKDLRPPSPFRTVGRNIPGGINTLADQPIERVPAPAPTSAAAPTAAPAPAPAPTRDPKQVDLQKLHALAIANGNSAMSPSRVGIAQNIKPAPTTNAPVNAGGPGGPGGAGGAPQQDEVTKALLDALKQPAFKPSTPKSVEELDREKQTFVDKQPTSAEAQALMKHYDAMAKRYAANDEAEKAQQARNASNNLATFLMSTRGGSLGIAAGKANAALQPLLADQETRRQTFQKLRDDQEMLLGKVRYELAQAERARKEGRFDDARKHQLEVQKAETEIAKIEEQRRGHTLTGGVGLLNAQEQKRYHNILAGQNAETRRENQRRFDLQMGQRQEELDERIRNNRMNNQRLVQGLNKNIDAARVKLSRLPKDSKELAPMREEQEALIRGWMEEKQMLLDEINRPTGYDPSKVRKVGN